MCNYNSDLKFQTKIIFKQDIENKTLSNWVHNKIIQKACESFRISDKQKEYLRGFKIYQNLNK